MARPCAQLESTFLSCDFWPAVSNPPHDHPIIICCFLRHVWSNNHESTPPSGAGAMKEMTWDTLKSTIIAKTLLLEEAEYKMEGVHLLAMMHKYSGMWLQALPISFVCLRMDDSTIHIAIGLRLGTAICVPHSCQLCSADVAPLETHELSCKFGKCRHSRHAVLNDIIHCTLSAARIPSRLEPSGL